METTSLPYQHITTYGIYIEAVAIGIIASSLMLISVWGAHKAKKQSTKPLRKPLDYDAEVRKLIESVESEILWR